jgi:hypothetical protein
MRTRVARTGLLASALIASMAVAAFAAGEKVDTTVVVKKVTKITKTTPGQGKLSWSFDIAKPDGTRAANLSGGTLTLPKATYADVTGFKACPLARLEANDNKSCPAKSVVGKADAHIYSAPVREEPYESQGIIYYTGGGQKKPKFAAYWTLVEIPSAHSVTPMKVTKSGSTSKVDFDQPRIPTVPGLPDATVLDIAYDFNTKGSKGLLFRLAKPCKSGTRVPSRYTFYDGSSATSSSKAC